MEEGKESVSHIVHPKDEDFVLLRETRVKEERVCGPLEQAFELVDV